jgi:hypothetical protein
MIGVIRKRDVLRHPVATVQSFGWRVFLRTLRAGQNETFLSVVAEVQAAERVQLHFAPLMESAIACELRTMHVYLALAARFEHELPIKRFLSALASHEQGHAELLRICAQASHHALTDEHRLSRLADLLIPLQVALAKAECALTTDIGRSEALRLVVQIEGAEINHLFEDLIAANPSPFVDAIQAFQKATTGHVAYIRRVLPTLAPEVEADCQKLVA